MTLMDKSSTDAITHLMNKSKYARKGVAGTALGLGIAGTALGLFGDRFGGLFGRDNHHFEHRVDDILAKENADVLALTNQIWGNRVYTDGQIAMVTKDANDKFFVNYKETRDSKDILMNEISNLKTEVAVLKATAPYQQEITAAAIANSALQSQINLINRTRCMIEGTIMVPQYEIVPATTPSGATTAANNG